MTQDRLAGPERSDGPDLHPRAPRRRRPAGGDPAGAGHSRRPVDRQPGGRGASRVGAGPRHRDGAATRPADGGAGDRPADQAVDQRRPAGASAADVRLSGGPARLGRPGPGRVVGVGFRHVAESLRVLVIGAGGREHALVLALTRDPQVAEIHAAPGNPGTAQHATNHSVDAQDGPAVAALASRLGVNLVVIGPGGPTGGRRGRCRTRRGHRLLRPVGRGRPDRGQQGLRQRGDDGRRGADRPGPAVPDRRRGRRRAGRVRPAVRGQGRRSGRRQGRGRHRRSRRRRVRTPWRRAGW